MMPIHRRSLLWGAAAAVTAAWGTAHGESIDAVRALLFDVFGTVVDWRTGVARESERILKPMGYSTDWLAFADAWRAQYQPSMQEVRSGRVPFVKLDTIHRQMLDRIRPQFGLDKLDEQTLAELNRAWHRLDAWPDVEPGFARLQRRLLLCSCSNGNIAIMADLARRNGFHWDAILGSEIARDFKPNPRVYLLSVEALNLQPENCMMVAAHSDDLRAAAALGLRTGFVARPNEFGPGTGETAPKLPVDVAVGSFADLADKFGG
jgi:2-haloacid dehalogenase